MKTLTFVVAALAIACAPCGAGAQGKAGAQGQSKPYAACMDKPGNTTTDMVECIGQEIKREDVRLNNAYKVLMAGISPGRKTQLQEAQRAWIKFKDANCSFYLDPDGGSFARIEANQCVLDATIARGRELESLK
jgi:uncharacterized protein YecT (DUF1311 family)